MPIYIYLSMGSLIFFLIIWYLRHAKYLRISYTVMGSEKDRFGQGSVLQTDYQSQAITSCRT